MNTLSTVVAQHFDHDDMMDGSGWWGMVWALSVPPADPGDRVRDVVSFFAHGQGVVRSGCSVRRDASRGLRGFCRAGGWPVCCGVSACEATAAASSAA